MDVELWIFITAGLLFAFCAGAIVGCVATRWGMARDVEVIAERKDTAIDAAMGTAFELQRMSGDTPAVLYDQDAPEQVEHGIDPADYFGIRVDVPRQPPAMTGVRDVDAQDRELADIYDIDAPDCNPVVVWAGANGWTVSCTCGHQDDCYDTGQAAHEAMSRHLDARQGVD